MILKVISVIVKAKRKIFRIIQVNLFKVYLRLLNINYGENLRIEGFPTICKFDNSRIEIGSDVVLCSSENSNPIGLNHKVVIRTLSDNSYIIIGNSVGISGGSICSAVGITIGDNVMLGANVTITDTDFHPIKSKNRRFNKNEADILKKEVVIEENVWIGMNSIILKGVKIGENSIIAAGSIVNKDIPSNCIAGGIPARVIRYLNADE